MTIALTGDGLTIDDMVAIARGTARVALADEARKRMQASLDALKRALAEGRPVYGLTTGVGALEGRAAVEKGHQEALIRSHACGLGPPLPTDEVRALIVCRANALARGLSGVRPELVDALLRQLDSPPAIPSRGSVGASDLTPLAHLGLALLDRGFRFEGREGLALINGLAQSAGTAALAVADAARLVEAAEDAIALGMLALNSPRSALDPRDLAARPHPGAVASAERLRTLTEGIPPGDAFREPLSTRCAHQITGAARDAIAAATGIVTREINAAVDNPLIAADGWLTSNAAACQGQHLAETMDALATSVASLAVSSERRVARLLSGDDGLPAFLVPPTAPPGSSGLMIVQYTAAALVAELRMRSVPASLQSIPTSAGNEDRVSMAPLAAARAQWAVKTTTEVVAIEQLVAVHALRLAGRAPSSALEPLAATLPKITHDRSLSPDIEHLAARIRVA